MVLALKRHLRRGGGAWAIKKLVLQVGGRSESRTNAVEGTEVPGRDELPEES